MKVFGRVIVVGIFMVLLAAQASFAQSFTTAKKDGSNWIEDTTFLSSEKPWLHVNVPDGNFFSDVTVSFWNYAAPGSSYFLANMFSGYAEYEKASPNDIYLSFIDPQWSTMVKEGDWEISASTMLFTTSGPYAWTTVKSYNGNVPFKITPEPVSSTLFILGAGTLAMRFLKKKKA